MSASAAPYTLLIALGETPQVLTETVYMLRKEDGRVPSTVHVVSTGTGAQSARTLLLGEPLPFGHTLRLTDADAADRWTPFCLETLGLREVVPIEFHVACNAAGQPLDDVQTPADDAAFANLCYGVVARLTEGDAPAVVGSISGGRKTMSAHLMTAFSVYARACDELTHVLVTPRTYEFDRTFFHPRADTPDARLYLVRPPFPRLQSVIERGLLRLGAPPRGDLRAVLDALAPLHAAEASVARLHGTFVGTGSAVALQLVAEAADGTSIGAPVTLTPALAALWLVLRDEIARAGHAEPGDATDDATDQRRRAVLRMLSDTEGKAYTRDDLTRRMSDLRTAFRAVPVIERCAGLAPHADPGPYGSRVGCPDLPLVFSGAEHVARRWERLLPHLPVPGASA